MRDTPSDTPIDEQCDGVCNILVQSFCTSDEKCTWIVDAGDAQNWVGHIGCAPRGAAQTGSACTRGSPGLYGYDDCVRGDYCLGPVTGGAGSCKLICDPMSGTLPCPIGFECAVYDDVFGPHAMPSAAGVCLATRRTN